MLPLQRTHAWYNTTCRFQEFTSMAPCHRCWYPKTRHEPTATSHRRRRHPSSVSPSRRLASTQTSPPTSANEKRRPSSTTIVASANRTKTSANRLSSVYRLISFRIRTTKMKSFRTSILTVLIKPRATVKTCCRVQAQSS